MFETRNWKTICLFYFLRLLFQISVLLTPIISAVWQKSSKLCQSKTWWNALMNPNGCGVVSFSLLVYTITKQKSSSMYHTAKKPALVTLTTDRVGSQRHFSRRYMQVSKTVQIFMEMHTVITALLFRGEEQENACTKY